MSQAYQIFFGFEKEPFISDIALKDILVTPELKEVYERMLYTIRLGSVFILTGEVGAGKSTALRWAMSQLHPSEYKIIKVTASVGTIIELYRQLLDELDLETKGASRSVLTKRIKTQVMELVLQKRQKPVIIIDEASLLRLEVFTELHTISQFESDSKPWLPIILAGQASLVDNLRYVKSAPLASRVVARTHLEATTLKQTNDYLKHHLKIAGVTNSLFNDSSVTAIHQGSGGLMRKINNLARGSLIAAASEGTKLVNAEHVRKASSELF
jgi:general secretion pathway protein A